ncbi:MAG: hypothetical protein BWX45_00528 [Deltaproteobacteria bacterium ADurb.Bin002]|nr:MAG: hypothetical protein BWX45_00528 [Deltaproteobacteria bacterium ADurb.Bin002]
MRPLFFGRLDVPLEILFPKPFPHERLRFLRGPHRLDDNVRLDAFGLNGPAIGRIVSGRRQFQGGAVLQGNHGLHGRFSEGLRPHNQRPAVVLQGARHNLRRAGRAFIHQDDNGRVDFLVAAVARRGFGFHLFRPAAGGHNHARLQKHVGHFYGLGQQSARIVAQIQHQALHGLGFFGHVGKRFAQVIGGSFMEGGNPNVADMVIKSLCPDAFYLNHGAGQRDVPRLDHILPQNRYGHLGVFRAAQLLHGLHNRNVFCGFTVNLDDRIAGFHARLERRCVLDGGHYRQHVLQDGNFNADSAETPLRFHFQLLVKLRRHKRAVRIERLDHAVDRALNQNRRIDFFHVVFLHHIQDFIEGFNLLVNIFVPRGNLAVGIRPENDEKPEEDYGQYWPLTGNIFHALPHCPSMILPHAKRMTSIASSIYQSFFSFPSISASRKRK